METKPVFGIVSYDATFRSLFYYLDSNNYTKVIDHCTAAQLIRANVPIIRYDKSSVDCVTAALKWLSTNNIKIKNVDVLNKPNGRMTAIFGPDVVLTVTEYLEHLKTIGVVVEDKYVP